MCVCKSNHSLIVVTPWVNSILLANGAMATQLLNSMELKKGHQPMAPLNSSMVCFPAEDLQTVQGCHVTTFNARETIFVTRDLDGATLCRGAWRDGYSISLEEATSHQKITLT